MQCVYNRHRPHYFLYRNKTSRLSILVSHLSITKATKLISRPRIVRSNEVRFLQGLVRSICRPRRAIPLVPGGSLRIGQEQAKVRSKHRRHLRLPKVVRPRLGAPGCPRLKPSHLQYSPLKCRPLGHTDQLTTMPPSQKL